jgi:GNAT superfamily N-acetyltransferase
MLPAEIDATAILCEYYAEEANIPEDEYDFNSVINGIRLRTIYHQHCWFNLYDGARPVGFISGYITHLPWNEKKFVGHIDLIFILESHRSLSTLKELMAKFEEWAKIAGADKITAGDIGVNPDRTRRLLEHQGFKDGLWMSKEIA